MLISHILLSYYITKLKEYITKQNYQLSRPLYNYQTPHNHLIWDVYGSNNYEKDKKFKQMQQ